jgi:DNA-binding XRE family transcriptional regulator
MASSEWTFKRLRDFQTEFGITNVLIASLLGISRSTVSHWKAKKDDEKLPLAYWVPLEDFERKCRHIQEETKASLDPSSIGGGLAGAILGGLAGLGAGGPLGSALGVYIGTKIGPTLVKEYRLSTDNPDERQCPYCAETIKKKAIFCKICRRDIPPA